jgi:chromosome partitioning protein
MGGSGKSTAAACLACHVAAAGKRVVMIDADPQRSLAHWHGLGDPPLELTVIAEAGEGVGHLANTQAGSCDLVVIDTAGFRNRTMIEALSVADLALVPIKPSPLDIAAALETVALIAEVGATKERGRRLPVRLVLSQVTVGSVIARHVREQLEHDGHALLRSEFANRVAYAEAALSGRMPLHMEPRGSAARDGKAFTKEVLALLSDKGG